MLITILCLSGASMFVFMVVRAGESSAPQAAKSGPATQPATQPGADATCSTDPNAGCGVGFWKDKTDEEWRKILTPEQYKVARQAGTERPFTGKYWNDHTKGIYQCAACGQELFASETKFDSGTGWPSFFQPIRKEAVTDVTDASHGMSRTEVRCSRCAAHLGHVFNDGPKPTGLRYCMNSAVLNLVPTEDKR